MTQLEALSEESTSNSEAREEMISTLIQEQETSSEKFRQDLLTSVTGLFESHLASQKMHFASCLAAYQEKEKSHLSVHHAQFSQANERVESALASSKSIMEQTQSNTTQKSSLLNTLVSDQELSTNHTNDTLSSLRSGYQEVFDGSRARDSSVSQEIKGMTSQVDKMLVDREAERDTESSEMVGETETKVAGVKEDMASLESAVGKRSMTVGGDMIEHLGGSSLAADEMRGFLSGGELALSKTGEEWTQNVKTQSTPAPRAPFTMEHATIASDEDMLSTYRAEFEVPSTPLLGNSSMCDSTIDLGEKLSASCPTPSSSSPTLEGSGGLTRSTNSSLTQICLFFFFFCFFFFFFMIFLFFIFSHPLFFFFFFTVEEEAAKRPTSQSTPSKSRISRKRTRETSKGGNNENLTNNSSSLKQPTRVCYLFIFYYCFKFYF